MSDLLFELGTEELPARFVGPALEDIGRTFVSGCRTLKISHGPIRLCGTPRRLALLAADVADVVADNIKRVQGPPVSAAFEKDGTTPKIAGTKFAQSVGIPLEQIKLEDTSKGRYLVAEIVEKGGSTLALLPQVLRSCAGSISFAKKMRWGDGEQTFGRPLQWIVALLGAEVVPFVFGDVRSDRKSWGHRFLAPEPIVLSTPDEYESRLEQASVVVDLDKRRALLVERINARAAEAGGVLRADDALVNEVLNLVELPVPLVGAFDAHHLDLPPEVLVQEMKTHQRYFSLMDAAGKLLPKFIAVSNTPVKDPHVAVKGYERVLRARLTDGRFFFDEDRRKPLTEHQANLSGRSWVEGLGTMKEKAARIQRLSAYLATASGNSRLASVVDRAAMLCKADLSTSMVGEFPELQGVMGREYALREGEAPEVALAMFEHYLPRGANDGLPTQDAGALVGLADRLDSLCGLFGIGKRPTGAKDEFGLRRAAIGFIRIVLSRGYRFSLGGAIDSALELLAPKLEGPKSKVDAPALKEAVLEYLRGRLQTSWREETRADVVEAVLDAGFDDLVQSQLRLKAMEEYVLDGDFVPLATAFKRVANILQKQDARDLEGIFDPLKAVVPVEKELHAAVVGATQEVARALAIDDYAKVLATTLSLKPLIDAFFAGVMVMTDNRDLRVNRLCLLRKILALVEGVADLSKIQVELVGAAEQPHEDAAAVVQI